MKISLFLLAAVFLFQTTAAEKTFELTFDDYTVKPQLAKGSAKARGFNEPDLQLRMHKGINNRGNALNLGNRERLNFPMKGNFNPKQGTVILWIAPTNWEITDAKYQLFFYVSQTRFNFRIAKSWPNYISATIQYYVPYQGKKSFGASVQSRQNPADWSKGKYHQVAVTWTGETMNLYIDGRTPSKTPLFIGNRRVAPTRPAKKFPIPVELPEPTKNGSFTIGASDWIKPNYVNPDHSTAFDSVTVWDSALTADQIREEYEKIVPAVKDQKINRLSIPKLNLKSRGDGSLSDPVWAKAAKVPLLPVSSAPDNGLSASVWHDGKLLHIGFHSNEVCQKKNLTKRDAKVWNDDAFEFFLLTDKKDLFHYVVNGNGVIFDELNRKSSWNGKAKAAVKHTNKGWNAELTIPLAEFNADKFTGDFCAGSRPGILYHGYRWGSNAKSFGPAGAMKLETTAEAFRLDKVGEPEYGQFDPSGFNSGKAQLKISREGENPENIPLPAGKFCISKRLEPGRQLLEITSGDIFYWHRELTVRNPLGLSFDFDYRTQVLLVMLDLSSADDAMQMALTGKGVPVELSLVNAEKQVVAKESVLLKKQKSEVRMKLSSLLPAGNYILWAKSGTVSAEIPLRRPNPEPYTAHLGQDHRVPAPWTPVKELAEKRFQVWGRTYEFKSGPLPEQVIHGKDPLLVEAPSWSLNGAPITWKDGKITDRQPDYITMNGMGTAGNLQLNWKASLWFDGAYILTLKVSPTKGKATVRDFGFRYAVPAEFGRYAMNPAWIPWKNGRAEVQLGPGQNRKDNLIWLSGVEKGIMFWTESNANWVTPKGNAPLAAVRKADRSEVEIRIIGKPVELTRPAEYRFVFMGTPSRPFPEGSRAVNYSGGRRNPYNTHFSIGWGQFNTRIHGDDPIHFNTTYPAYPEKLRKAIADNLKRNGSKLHYYTMPGTLSNTTSDFDYWSKRDISIPEFTESNLKNGERFKAIRFCTLATDAPADYWCWTLNRLLKDFPGMGGLYFDCMATTFCSNSRHGCSGIDVFGQPYFRSDALGLRNFLMRVYKIHQRYPGTSMMIHSHIQFVPFVHEFTDFFAPGENTFESVCNNPEYPYTEEIPLEEFQSNYNSRKAGVAFCMLLQNYRAAKIMPSLNRYQKLFLDDPEYAIRAITPFLVHDVNIWDIYVHRGTVIRYWKMRKDADFSHIDKFIGYWEKGCPVNSGAEKVYCSVYEWKNNAPWRYAVAVGNFTRQEKEIKLQIDWKALGIEPPQTVHELWTKKDIPVSELGKFKLNGGHFALFGIK